ncbi:MAG: hypothetical protein M5R36_01290 [Deltaproteobacteria bacterium]|nr:hypothetical protein [Deltaproteobacteria bacterium]
MPQLSLGASMLQNNDLTRIVKSWGVDAEARWGGLSVLAEMIRTRFEPEFDEGTVVEQYASDWETGGWFVQGGAFVIPRRVELAARYEEYYLELLDDVDERRLVAASTYGLNLHFASQHRMKLMTNYVRHVELEGLPQVDDDTWTVQGSLRF